MVTEHSQQCENDLVAHFACCIGQVKASKPFMWWLPPCLGLPSHQPPSTRALGLERLPRPSTSSCWSWATPNTLRKVKSSLHLCIWTSYYIQLLLKHNEHPCFFWSTLNLPLHFDSACYNALSRPTSCHQHECISMRPCFLYDLVLVLPKLVLDDIIW